MLGALLICYATPMLRSGDVGRALFFGIGIFWAIRLIVQIWYYEAELWRGNRAKICVHALAILLCLYFAGTCLWAGILTSKT